MMQGVCHVPNKISCNIELQTKYQYLISTRDKTSFSPQKYNLKGTTRHKICLPTVILKFWPWWWPLSGLALHYLDFYPNTSLKRNIFFWDLQCSQKVVRNYCCDQFFSVTYHRIFPQKLTFFDIYSKFCNYFFLQMLLNDDKH